ncbi:MAG TPA: hypothetical protein DDW78_03505 [Treponema sp.]|nr:hypothetical protein [Treponema sp.]
MGAGRIMPGVFAFKSRRCVKMTHKILFSAPLRQNAPAGAFLPAICCPKKCLARRLFVRKRQLLPLPGAFFSSF